MPLVIGLLIVVATIYQLFFRYESWESDEKPGVIYEHVAPAVPRIVAGDLLQRDHVGAAHRVGNARDVILPIKADAVLDVVGYKLHSNISPADPKRPLSQNGLALDRALV